MNFRRILLRIMSVVLICGYSNIFSWVHTADTPTLVEEILALRTFLNDNQATTDDKLIRYLLNVNPDVLAVANDTLYNKWVRCLQDAIDRVPSATIQAMFMHKATQVENNAGVLNAGYLSADVLYDDNATIDDLMGGEVSDFLLASNERAYQKWYLRIAKALRDELINGDEEAYKQLLDHKNERAANVAALRDVISTVSKR